jgi:hypothetical protein
LGDNTVTGTIAEFNTALQSESFATLGGTETLASKTLSAPTLTGTTIAATLDISGDVDVDGTLETDALTINGTTLEETIADTVGTMVASNTESGITVAYQDADNTLDFTVGTLNQDTTGTAAIATTVTITDNESTNEDNAIIFTAGGDLDGGNLGLESDGDLKYNPSTGLLTSTGGAFTTIAMAGGIDMNEQSITEIKRFDTKIPSDVSYSSTVNIDFDTNEEIILGQLTGNITFTSSNEAKGKHKTIHMESDGSARSFTFPDWFFYGTEPSATTASKKSVLSLTCLGTADTDVRAVYVEEV